MPIAPTELPWCLRKERVTPETKSRAMHVAIDAHAVGTKLAGNETYITGLIEALAAIDCENRYTLYVTKPQAVRKFARRWPNVELRRTLPHTPFIRIPLSLVAELCLRPVDLLHVQFTAPPVTPCPVVVTVHDLAFEHLPETFRRRSWMQLRLTVRWTTKRAAQIIVPSEYTRRDLIATYGIAPDRITVTPLAAASRFAPVEAARVRRVCARYGIQGAYILAVGSIQPRKNLGRLFAAYERLQRKSAQGNLPRLVVVGKRAWLFETTLRAAERLGDRVLFTGYVPEEDLPPLYAGALCFVYPSFFEGFGLPPLEAMQCGTPVLVGNRTSLPEVVGEAGLMVNPFDEAELAEALERLIEDASLRAELSRRGLERARQFNWHHTARLTLEAYKKAAGAA
ncbi:MAG: glycosyltransferase family 1 protein [Pyrinomonas sp.]|uniref:glycosyltransferase family 4 protein n=1 Tax=Pyrinomonas sp. TaxID=2080306 RepID=UPI0033220FFE